MEKFIVCLQSELGEQAAIAEIEKAVSRHYSKVLSEDIQALVNDRGTIPLESHNP